MNAQQRRKAKRYWRYRIRLSDEYFLCDDGIQGFKNASDWCSANIGRYQCDWAARQEYSTFYFHKSESAALFSLKWL